MPLRSKITPRNPSDIRKRAIFYVLNRQREYKRSLTDYTLLKAIFYIYSNMTLPVARGILRAIYHEAVVRPSTYIRPEPPLLPRIPECLDFSIFRPDPQMTGRRSSIHGQIKAFLRL
jgi:hypothetical protein